MKIKHDPWKLLVKAAGGAAWAPDEEAPFGFAGRVLAAWRAETGADDWVLWRPALRLALVGAAALMLCSAVLGYLAQPEEEPVELAFTESIVLMSFNR